MGQYYTPVLKDKNNNFEYYYSHDYDNGLKLMEHSYINNNFVERIVKRLLNNPMRIAWVGDYADEEDFKQNLDHKDLQDFIHVAEKESAFKKGSFDTLDDMECSIRLYMINHTKKLYISMYDYFIDNVKRERNSWDYGFCIHPLPLLTALGNGKGGGDYRGCNANIVGCWAGDLIEFGTYETINEQCKDYVEINPMFREG